MIRTILLTLFALALACNAAFANPGDAAAAAGGSACVAASPFYWEVGTVDGPQAMGSVQPGRKGFDRGSMLQIASASKWPYGAFVNEVRAGKLSADDTKFLNFRSGYTRFDNCEHSATVGSCAAGAVYNRRADGKFSYSGGHMQKHAATLMPGLGALTNAGLAAKVNSTLGTTFTYSQPQLAGGIVTSAAAYGAFLRLVMSDKLVDGKYLRADAVPTQGPQALVSPVPEPWSYGRGHWIELDGTASSPGAFGFYPWISADKKLYGIVARSAAGSAWVSVQCGRAIRAAYLR